MCCCKEDSILCCKGKFLSERNQRFSKLIDDEFTSDETSEEHASIIEALIAKYLAPELLSSQGRALILIAWLLLIGCSLNGATRMVMDFSMDFFLIPDQPITDFVILNNKYFKEGSYFKIFYKLDQDDLASEEMQHKILDFYEKLYRCYLCDENWMQKQLIWE